MQTVSDFQANVLNKQQSKTSNRHFFFAELRTMTEEQRLLQSNHILEALALAKSASERTSALGLALVAFDHDDLEEHDSMSEAGAITLVTRCLQKDYASVEKLDDSSINLMDSYLKLIDMMFRCSDRKAVTVFYRIGADLVSLLISLLYEYHELDAPNDAILTLTDKLARLNVSLQSVQKVELLVRLIQQVIRGEYEYPILQTTGLQLLGGWTQHPDSKRYILNRPPGLIDDVIAAALQQSSAVSAKPLHIATFFSNLAWEVRSKSELVNNRNFLKALALLLDDANLATCKVSIDTVRQLATEAHCRRTLCKHEKGVIIVALMRRMDQQEFQSITNQALLRLIDRDSAPRLLKRHSTIVEQLASSAIVGKDYLNGHDASILAAQSLRRLASYIAVKNKAHPTLLDALTTLATANNAKIRFWATKGLSEQSKSSTGCFYIARAPNILQTLIRLARHDPSKAVKSTATEALLILSSDDANARRLASSSEVLETFVENVKQAERYRKSGRSAIQAILSLASHKTANKEKVAKTIGLVESLSKYGISNDMDSELKRAALHCVIVLAPLM